MNARDTRQSIPHVGSPPNSVHGADAHPERPVPAAEAVIPEAAVWDAFFQAPGLDLPLREQPTVQERPPLA